MRGQIKKPFLLKKYKTGEYNKAHPSVISSECAFFNEGKL